MNGRGCAAPNRRKPRLRLWTRPLNMFLGIAATTVLAEGATAPIAAYHFNQFVIGGMIANEIAIPAHRLLDHAARRDRRLGHAVRSRGLAVEGDGLGLDWLLDLAHWTANLPYAVIFLEPWPVAAFCPRRSRRHLARVMADVAAVCGGPRDRPSHYSFRSRQGGRTFSPTRAALLPLGLEPPAAIATASSERASIRRGLDPASRRQSGTRRRCDQAHALRCPRLPNADRKRCDLEPGAGRAGAQRGMRQRDGAAVDRRRAALVYQAGACGRSLALARPRPCGPTIVGKARDVGDGIPRQLAVAPSAAVAQRARCGSGRGRRRRRVL